MIEIILTIVFSIIWSNYVAKNCKSLHLNNKHIHHWMWGSIGLLISFFYKLKFTSAVFLGIVLEGLSYNDRFVI